MSRTLEALLIGIPHADRTVETDDKGMMTIDALTKQLCERVGVLLADDGNTIADIGDDLAEKTGFQIPDDYFEENLEYGSFIDFIKALMNLGGIDELTLEEFKCFLEKFQNQPYFPGFLNLELDAANQIGVLLKLVDLPMLNRHPEWDMNQFVSYCQVFLNFMYESKISALNLNIKRYECVDMNSETTLELLGQFASGIITKLGYDNLNKFIIFLRESFKIIDKADENIIDLVFTLDSLTKKQKIEYLLRQYPLILDIETPDFKKNFIAYLETRLAKSNSNTEIKELLMLASKYSYDFGNNLGHEGYEIFASVLAFIKDFPDHNISIKMYSSIEANSSVLKIFRCLIMILISQQDNITKIFEEHLRDTASSIHIILKKYLGTGYMEKMGIPKSSLYDSSGFREELPNESAGLQPVSYRSGVVPEGIDTQNHPLLVQSTIDLLAPYIKDKADFDSADKACALLCNRKYSITYIFLSIINMCSGRNIDLMKFIRKLVEVYNDDIHKTNLLSLPKEESFYKSSDLLISWESLIEYVFKTLDLHDPQILNTSLPFDAIIAGDTSKLVEVFRAEIHSVSSINYQLIYLILYLVCMNGDLISKNILVEYCKNLHNPYVEIPELVIDHYVYGHLISSEGVNLDDKILNSWLVLNKVNLSMEDLNRIVASIVNAIKLSKEDKINKIKKILSKIQIITKGSNDLKLSISLQLKRLGDNALNDLFNNLVTKTPLEN